MLECIEVFLRPTSKGIGFNADPSSEGEDENIEPAATEWQSLFPGLLFFWSLAETGWKSAVGLI